RSGSIKFLFVYRKMNSNPFGPTYKDSIWRIHKLTLEIVSFFDKFCHVI
ncbi:hypothetical protein CLONEX_02895, partial [[Clostridium] nexile DSM 1787]